MKNLKRAFALVITALILILLAACSDGEVCTPCVDSDSDLVCDRCGEAIEDVVCIPCVDADLDSICDRCGESLVSKDAPELTLSLTTPPSRTDFYTGEGFDKNGMVVTATLSDGSTVTVTDYALGVPASLDASVSEVFVYYGGAVLRVPINVSETKVIGVSDARREDYDKPLVVDGYFLGMTEHGFLIKDFEDDTLIEVRGEVPEYSVGDKVRLLASLKKGEEARTYYLDCQSEDANGVLSSDNDITAMFSTVTGVASWDRMTRSFKESSFKIGQYYKIYSDHIYVVKNSDGSLTLHLNNSATDINSIKPDGVRTVNVLGGTKGAEYISGLIGSNGDQLPGKCFEGVIHAVSLSSDSDSFDLTVPDASWVELGQVMTPMHEALVEVAHAFYYKGNYIHYDQYGTRRNINPSPESATKDERLHLDCSSFVNAVYYEAFGVNVQPYPTTERSPQTGVMTEYAKEFYGVNPDVIGYFETADLDTDEKKSEFVEMMRATLEVGDVIVCRRASSGHAILYVGNGYFLHSTGSSYEYSVGDPSEAYDQVDPKGTISKLMLSSYLDDEDNSRYILAPNVVTISLLRPLVRGLETTDVTDARMTIPGVSMEKFSSAPHRSAVHVGDTIVYTVSLKNNGASDLDGVTVTENLPEGVKYVGGTRGLVNNDGILTYVTSLAKGAEISVTYAVQVVSSEHSAISSTGDVNGVPLNEIFNTVSISMTESKAQSLVSLAKEFASEGMHFDDPIAMARALYSEAVGMNIISAENTMALLDSLINSVDKTFNSESSDADILVRGLYGGYDIRLGYRTDNDRTRLVVEHNLSVGDVIVGEYADDPVLSVYIYLGNGEFLYVTSENGNAAIFTLESSETKNLLVSLISYDRYVIVRPSQK